MHFDCFVFMFAELVYDAHKDACNTQEEKEN
jgi:hypothetical protein